MGPGQRQTRSRHLDQQQEHKQVTMRAAMTALDCRSVAAAAAVVGSVLIPMGSMPLTPWKTFTRRDAEQLDWASPFRRPILFFPRRFCSSSRVVVVEVAVSSWDNCRSNRRMVVSPASPRRKIRSRRTRFSPTERFCSIPTTRTTSMRRHPIPVPVAVCVVGPSDGGRACWT